MSETLSALSVDEIIARLGAQSTCDAGLTQDPWHFDTTKPSYGPGASMLDKLPHNAPRQQVLPESTATPPTRSCRSAFARPSPVSAASY